MIDNPSNFVPGIHNRPVFIPMGSIDFHEQPLVGAICMSCHATVHTDAISDLPLSLGSNTGVPDGEHTADRPFDAFDAV
jgi:hypothetical protein